MPDKIEDLVKAVTEIKIDVAVIKEKMNHIVSKDDLTNALNTHSDRCSIDAIKQMKRKKAETIGIISGLGIAIIALIKAFFI